MHYTMPVPTHLRFARRLLIGLSWARRCIAHIAVLFWLSVSRGRTSAYLL